MTQTAACPPESGEPVLAIAAAGLGMSVAVAAGGRVLAVQEHRLPHGQAEALLPLIDRAMREAGLPAAAIATIAVEIGPGSFTGIRVGLAAARGIALATGAALVGVTGFQAAAAGVEPGDAPLLVALESRREDLFVQLFDAGLAPVGAPEAVLPAALEPWLACRSAPRRIAGDAAGRALAALARPRLQLAAEPGGSPAARVLRGAQLRRAQGLPNLPARPFYLRPPDVTARRESAG